MSSGIPSFKTTRRELWSMKRDCRWPNSNHFKSWALLSKLMTQFKSLLSNWNVQRCKWSLKWEQETVGWVGEGKLVCDNKRAHVSWFTLPFLVALGPNFLSTHHSIFIQFYFTSISWVDFWIRLAFTIQFSLLNSLKKQFTIFFSQN